MTHILYLYKAGRAERRTLADSPDEFFYGAAGLGALGHEVDELDAAALGALAGVPAPDQISGALWKLLAFFLRFLVPAFPSVIASHMWSPAARRRFDSADVIVATTTGQAIALCALKRAGLLRAQAFVLAMGILADVSPGIQLRLFVWLLGIARVASISKLEFAFLRTTAPRLDLHYLAFGVDTRFWTPGVPANRASPYVLSIGNDRNRDYATLLAAWRPEFPVLRIVTNHRISGPPANVEVTRGDWHERALSDVEVREIYRGAALVVLPIRQTGQPSGQSACLQAMACGCAVVITRVDGFWDPESILDGDTCRLVPPGDVAALTSAVAEILANPSDAVSMGARARRLVETQFDSGAMASAIDRLISGKEAVPA
ncbi:MAG: glycosyltransferase [Alphaproteobacteria bacterium]|nr:glycosyltransferase [Alphaproteobacteria bacterium]